MQSDIDELTAAILAFRDARDWKQFHTPDHLAKCISVEAGELLECFLWKSQDEVNVQRVKEELADILYATLLLSHTLAIDIGSALQEKLERNAEKYPVDKAKGSNKKYNDLD